MPKLRTQTEITSDQFHVPSKAFSHKTLVILKFLSSKIEQFCDRVTYHHLSNNALSDEQFEDTLSALRRQKILVRYYAQKIR